MAFIDGRGSRFRIADAGSVLRDLSAYITEIRGLPGDRALNDVTALGDSGARFKPGGESASFTLRGIFDDTPDVGADDVLGALRNPRFCHAIRVRSGRLCGWQGAIHRRMLGKEL